MKRLFTVLASCVAIFMLGCESEEETGGGKLRDNDVISASAPEAVSRTFIDGIDVKWSEGDEICVLNAEEWVEKRYKLSEGAGTAVGSFSTNDAAAEGPVFAFYPASIGKINGTIYFVNYPDSQTYVENSIAPNTLPMFAYGEDRSGLQFGHIAGVLRLEAYTDVSDPVKIQTVTVLSSSVISGEHYFAKSSLNRFFGRSSSNTASKRVTYQVGGVKLSSDPANPTIFNIVVAATAIEELAFLLESTDGRQFIQKKNSTLTVEKGELVKFPAFQCDFTSVSDNMLVRIDGGNWNGWSDNMQVPLSSIEVKTLNGFLLTESRLADIALLVSSAANNGSISVDLSQTTYESDIFPKVFSNNMKLKEIALPANVVTISLQALYRCSYLTDCRMHDGVTTINDQAFNYTRINPLYIPKTVTRIGNFILRGTEYGDIAYDVDPENPAYKSVDGVLFSKDGKILHDFPEGNGWSTYTVPQGVETLRNYSIMEASSITELRLPSTLKTVMSSAFQNMSYLNTIYCEALVPPTLHALSYRPTTPDNSMNPGFKVDPGTQKVIYVPEGTKAAYEAAWEQMTVAGWVFDDGSAPQGASASIGGLNENTDYQDIEDFWK